MCRGLQWKSGGDIGTDELKIGRNSSQIKEIRGFCTSTFLSWPIAVVGVVIAVAYANIFFCENVFPRVILCKLSPLF